MSREGQRGGQRVCPFDIRGKVQIFFSVSLVMSEHEANAAFKKRNENDNNAML